MIKTLLFSTLYPSAARPVHGIFVETRLRELLKTGEVETRVVAPVPWFPFKSSRFGEYAQMAATPREEHRNGVQVFHPRYFLPPRLGMNIAPYTMAAAAWPTVQRLIANGFDFDLIDAHYYYPDGVAAAILARRLKKPLVVTARGTDLSLIPEFRLPRQKILHTARMASASIGVCRALMERLQTLGAEPHKLHVMRNGVDLERFRPESPDASRARIGLAHSDAILLSVGHLIERKGHHIAIAAMSSLPAHVRLVIVGTGPDRRKLEQQAAECGVADRVKFVGQVPQDELRWWYSAADALVLCSSREGWANVLLESMACGTPVLASNIWGTPEIVSCAEAGVLLDELSAQGLVKAWEKLGQAHIDRIKTRQFAERFSWLATSTAQVELFAEIVQVGVQNEVLT